MTDAEFVAAFENCSLTREEWTHTAHVRLAWVCLSSGQPFEIVLTRVRQGIQRFNSVVIQKPDGYHETITHAFLRLIADRFRGGEDFQEFCERNPDLLSSRVLANFYSKELLDSSRARRSFVPPDLRPLP